MGFACPSRALIHPLLQGGQAQLTVTSGPVNVTEGYLGPNSASVLDEGSRSPIDERSHFGHACSRDVSWRWQKMQVFILAKAIDAGGTGAATALTPQRFQRSPAGSIWQTSALVDPLAPTCKVGQPSGQRHAASTC